MTRTHAAADQRPGYRLEVAPQLVTQALKEFAHQTRLQVVYYTDIAEGIASPGATGAMTLEAALDRLLAGTGLEYILLNERTIAIRQQGGAARKDSSQKSSGAYPWAEDLVIDDNSGRERVTLAQAGTAGASTDQVQSVPSSQQELPGPEEMEKAIPEMLIKGRRTLNTDIQRSEDGPQPYVVFQREQIERSMASNVEDFLKTRLPMNTAQQTNNQAASNQLGNQSSIDLRGLGKNQTLILVDGRRMPGVRGESVSFGQPDINGIPLVAIERIEVLPSTGSGIYGGSATGGVVNIITRQHVGLEVGANYASPLDTNAGEYRLDAVGGVTLEGGRTHVRLVASYSEADPLLVGDRDFIDRARALQLANNPNAFATLFAPPQGHTSNICSATLFGGGTSGSCNTTPLVLDNGTPLGSNRTFVPVGYQGPATDGGVALVANAGQYNLDLSNDAYGARQSLRNNPTIRSAALNVRRDFTEWLEAFVDVSLLENQGQAYYSGFAGSAVLPADSPNNPFTSPILVSFPAPGVFFPFDSTSETLTATGGVIVRLPRDWAVAADYSWTRSRFDYSQTNPAVGDPDGSGPGVSWATALRDDPTLSVVRDLNLSPLDFAPYQLRSPNSIFGPGETVHRSLVARVSGPIVEIPGGPLTLSGSAETREEEAAEVVAEAQNLTGNTNFTWRPEFLQEVDAYYLELWAPLISRANAMRFGHALELQASARREEYTSHAPTPFNVFGSSTNGFTREGPWPATTDNISEFESGTHTFALRYAPLQDVALRASIGTGFLPPGLSQTVPGQTGTLNVTVVDPKRGGVSVTYPNVSRQLGGNPELGPEESESWSVGVILTPRFLPGLRLSMDYTNIEKTGEIAGLNAQQVFDLEDKLPAGRVERAPLTDADAALGYTGGVPVAIDLTSININGTRLEAYDVQADYTWQAGHGEFSLYAIATYQPFLERQTVPTQPFVDSAGGTGGPLSWRGNAGLSWQRGPLTLGWEAQYFDSYLSYFKAFPATRDAAVLNQGSDTIPSQTYHDVFARYRWDEPSGLMSGVEIRFGIQNVFDESPPILATTGTSGGYSFYGDPRLRRYSLTFRKSFGLER